MGWDGIYCRARSREAFFETVIRSQIKDSCEVADYAIKGTTIYVAVRHVVTGRVDALCVLTGKSGGDFWTYKWVGENEGPAVDNCPLRILRLLSPTDNQYALEWRDRCYAKFKRRK